MSAANTAAKSQTHELNIDPSSSEVVDPTIDTENKATLLQDLRTGEEIETDAEAASSNDSEDEYKHNLEVGDHIIRWSHFGYMWPIQIHGIVLEVVSNKSVEIADFGLTQAQPADGNEKSREYTEAMKAAFSTSDRKRLNKITLTGKDEICGWSKVNYGDSLFDTPGKSLGKWSSWWQPNPSKDPTTSNKDDTSDENSLSARTLDGDEIKSEHLSNTTNIEAVKENRKLDAHGLKVTSAQGKENEIRPPSKTGKTLDDLIAEANAVDGRDRAKRRSPQSVSSDLTSQSAKPLRNSLLSSMRWNSWKQANNTQKSAPSELSNDDDDRFAQPETRQSSSTKLLSSINWTPWRDASDPQQLQSLSGNNESATTRQQQTKSSNKLPKSDPTKLVIARVNFLFEHENDDGVIPPYNVFHSNSECIAVWCKTGTWSTLQSAVFLHSTVVGNAKQTVAALGGIVALNPLLIAAAVPLGIAYTGAPWLYLNKCNEKCEEATRVLTDKFWSWAEPEVFVEVIHHWSGLTEGRCS